MKKILIAMCLVALTLPTLSANDQRARVLLQAAEAKVKLEGDLNGAIKIYKEAEKEAGANRALVAQALLKMAEAYQKLGDAEAQKIYQRLIRDFSDQKDVVNIALTLATKQGVQTARRVSTNGGYGRPSQDGRYMAWGQCCGTGDLGVRDLLTNTVRRLTDSGGWVKSGDYASAPVISPGNRYVAYEWFLEADVMTELRVVPFAGRAGPRTLIRTEQRYIRPIGWTPDSTRLLVFRGEPGDWHIGNVNVSDGKYARLKSFGWRNPGRLELSPDGRFVAYAAESGDTGSPHDIVVLAMDGSREGVVVAGPEDDVEPLWSADGAHLLFLRKGAGRTGLWAAPVSGGKSTGAPLLVKEDVGEMRPIGVIGDGSLYYATGGGVRQNVYVAPVAGFVASAPALVTGLSVDAANGVAWSPDGTLLTYWAAKPQPALVLRSTGTGEERAIPLPMGALPTATPEWFPDGRSVLISIAGPQGGETAFARFNIETGTVERLHQSPLTRGGSIDLAPDGSAIYWSIQGTNPSLAAAPSGRLMRFDLKTREERELKRDEWYLAIAVSPDGKELAYLKNTRTERDKGEAPGILEVMPAQGGPSRQVFRAPVWYTGTRYNTLAWTPDQRNLLAVQDDFVLWRIPVDGAPPQHMGLAGTDDLKAGGKLSEAERMIRSPRIHPDGKRIAFTLREEIESELWRLENFLPVLTSKK